MAQTTTAVNACDAVISLDNASGTLTDISGSSNEVNLTLTVENGVYRRAYSGYPVRYALSKDFEAELVLVYSTTTDEALDILRAWANAGVSSLDARTLRVDVPDSSSGSDRYQSEVVLGNLEIPLTASEGSPIMVSASVQGTGAYTATEIA